MENRSHALLAGIFTLVLLAAATLVAIWLGRDRQQLQTYEIVSATAVSGLTAQSAVRYQGVPVGRVQSLKLNPAKPGQVLILIGVAPATPITESTWAEIGVQGVTGQANIDLRDDGKSTVRLVSTKANVATIPLRPGFLERVEQRGDQLLSSVEHAIKQIDTLVSDENVRSFTKVMQNTSDLTTALREATQGIGPALAKLGPLLDTFNGISRQADHAARQVADLAQEARGILARLDAPDGPLATATRSMNDIALAASRLNRETLPAVTNMATSVGTAARGATTTLRRVGNEPQSILFGPAPKRPGPGEPGFSGFGSQAQ